MRCCGLNCQGRSCQKPWKNWDRRYRRGQYEKSNTREELGIKVGPISTMVYVVMDCFTNWVCIILGCPITRRASMLNSITTSDRQYLQVSSVDVNINCSNIRNNVVSGWPVFWQTKPQMLDKNLSETNRQIPINGCPSNVPNRRNFYTKATAMKSEVTVNVAVWAFSHFFLEDKEPWSGYATENETESDNALCYRGPYEMRTFDCPHVVSVGQTFDFLISIVPRKAFF